MEMRKTIALAQLELANEFDAKIRLSKSFWRKAYVTIKSQQTTTKTIIRENIQVFIHRESTFFISYKSIVSFNFSSKIVFKCELDTGINCS